MYLGLVSCSPVLHDTFHEMLAYPLALSPCNHLYSPPAFSQPLEELHAFLSLNKNS